MLPSERHVEAEQAIRHLLERQGLPAPDSIEHDPDSIVLLWHDRKLAVVIDLD